jgi:hypothetical protein
MPRPEPKHCLECVKSVVVGTAAGAAVATTARSAVVVISATRTAMVIVIATRTAIVIVIAAAA